MPSLPIIEKDQVRHAQSAPDGGAFDVVDAAARDPLEDGYYDYLLRLAMIR